MEQESRPEAVVKGLEQVGQGAHVFLRRGYYLEVQEVQAGIWRKSRCRAQETKNKPAGPRKPETASGHQKPRSRLGSSYLIT